MIRIPTRTAFRLLTAAVGVLAVALLAMVGLMLYQALTPKKVVINPQQVAAPAEDPLRNDRAVASSKILHDRLHPPEQAPATVANDNYGAPVDSHGGYRQFGTVVSGNKVSYVMLQDERTREDLLIVQGQEKEGIKLLEIKDGKAAVTVDGQTKWMTKQPLLVVAKPTAQQRGARPASAARRTPTTRQPAQATTATTSGSIRVISGGSSGNSSTQLRGGRTTEEWRAMVAEQIKQNQRARAAAQR